MCTLNYPTGKMILRKSEFLVTLLEATSETFVFQKMLCSLSTASLSKITSQFCLKLSYFHVH